VTTILPEVRQATQGLYIVAIKIRKSDVLTNEGSDNYLHSDKATKRKKCAWPAGGYNMLRGKVDTAK
jgi:hypothetical protein